MAKNKGYIRNSKQNIVSKSTLKPKLGKYDLSIGMIIKNEISYLEKCLEAISVLKEHISCEIIITDTGSTDGSIEIAKKYADKFLEFEWCDDFSAARNTGVNVAEGSWFMFLDADEIGDDSVMEIANFMKNKDRDKYNNAYITIKNYKELNEVGDILKSCRLLNFTQGKRYFVGTIHEHIPATVNRFNIPALFHHFGYLKSVLNEKAARNKMYLDRILEKEPEDIDALKYSMEVEQDLPKRLEKCLQAINLIESKKIEDDFNHSFYINACKIFAKLGKIAECFELGEHYLEIIGDDHHCPKLEILYLLGIVWKDKKNEERTHYYYSKYVETYDYLKENPDWRYASIAGYMYGEEVSYLAASIVASEYEGKYGDIDKARDFILNSNALDYTPDGKTFPFLEDVIKRATIIGDGDIVHSAYDKACRLFNKETAIYIMQVINKSFYELNKVNEENIKAGRGDRVKNFLTAFTSYGGNDSFIALNKLRLNDYKYSDFEADSMELLKNEPELFSSDIFIDVVYATLITGEDPFNFYGNTTKIQSETLISGLFQFRDGFELEIQEWIKNKNYNEITNLKELSTYNFIVSGALTKQVDIAEHNDDEFEKMENLLVTYVKSTTCYTNSLYKPEVLQDDYMSILPINEAFAFIVNQVIDERSTNQSEYLAGLKKAVIYYPTMKLCVQIIADKFKKVIEDETKIIDQFQELGNQVKQLLRTIIRQGNREQALQVLEQYRGINPTDTDILVLEQEIELNTK